MHFIFEEQPYSVLKASQIDEKIQKPNDQVLQAIIKLEAKNEQKYRIKFIQGQITIKTLSQGQDEPISIIQVGFNVKMSKLYMNRSQLERKQQLFLKGIKLQNANGLNISFFFKTSYEVNIWIKRLSLYVNQLHFQKEYKVIRKLGKGSSASVFQVRRLKDGKNFAVKVFSKQSFGQSQKKLQSLKKQIEIVRILNAYDILGFEGVYQDDKSILLVMQLVKGVTIFDFLLNQKEKLQASTIKLIMRNILENLECLQELDIIHRDIKLENIIIDSNTFKTTIIDYGLAIHGDDEDYIFYHCGTPGYISPETINSKKNNKITTKSDIFSAGVILYILLTGHFLFESKCANEVMKKNKNMDFNLDNLKQTEIEASAIDLLKKMLCLMPQDRLSAQECLDHDFLRIQSQIEDQQKPSTPSTVGDRQNYQL